MSRNLNSKILVPEIDGRWHGPDSNILVEVKKTSSTRDVRSAFLELAYALSSEPEQDTAVLVLVQTRLSLARLREELELFRRVAHPALAARINYLVVCGTSAQQRPKVTGSLELISEGFQIWLHDLVDREEMHGARSVPPMSSRHIVMTSLARLRLHNVGPVTIKSIQVFCGVSYPTVAALLSELRATDRLESEGSRGVSLRALSVHELMELGREHSKQRQSVLFTDPTGFGSPERLRKQLERLQKLGKLPSSILVGGVQGAAWYYPELDITSAPRLDLSASGSATQIARILDAGLEIRSQAHQRVVLAVHVAFEPKWGKIADLSDLPCANEIDCLADLIDMGYVREATEFASHIQRNQFPGPL